MKKEDFSSQNWAEEFKEFMVVQPVAPPDELSRKILEMVRRDLNPAAWLVFLKIALIHVVVGTLSLLLCPQFGIHFSSGFDLLASFMQFNPYACMFACGLIFLSGTALVATLLLRPEEVRVIRQTKILQLSILGLLSLTTFFCFGAPVITGLGIAWFLGSVFGGAVTLEFGWKMRKHLVYS